MTATQERNWITHHTITNTRSSFKLIRVYRGAEAAANTDHMLVVAEAALYPFTKLTRSSAPRLDTAKLVQDPALAEKYNVTVMNAFSALSDLPTDPEEAWATTRQTILTAAATIPVKMPQHRAWLTVPTLSVIQEKKAVRLRGDLNEWRRLRGIYKAK